MSPFIKNYLTNNLGKVVVLDEYIANLLTNEILSDPEAYGVIDVSPMNGVRPVNYWGLVEIGVLLVEGTIILKASSVVNFSSEGIFTDVQCWLETGDVTELSESEKNTLTRHILNNGVSLNEVAESIVNLLGDGVLQQVVLELGRSVYRLNLVRNSGKLLVKEYTEFGELKKNHKTPYEKYLLKQITKIIKPTDLTLVKLGLDIAGNVMVAIKH